MTDVSNAPPEAIVGDPDLRFEVSYDWTVVTAAVGFPLGALAFMYTTGNTSNLFMADGLFLKFALIPAAALLYRAVRVKLRRAPAFVVDAVGIHDMRGTINTVFWGQVRTAKLDKTWFRLPVLTVNYLPIGREPDGAGENISIAGLIMTERSAAILAAILHFRPELRQRAGDPP